MCGGGGKPPSAYTPKWQSGADSTLSGNLGSQSSQAGQISGYALPQLQTQTSNLINDPNAASAMATAGASSALGQGIGQGQIAQGQNLDSIAASLSPMAAQIYQTAFDPQQALYQRQYQQSMDAQNAMASMYGVASSPYGAGLAAQNANNFNLDWGNNQLGRMTAGAGAIQGLDSLAGNLSTTGANLQNLGLNTFTTSGMLPYQTSQGIYGRNLDALGQYATSAGAALAPGFTADSGLAGYMGLGQSATSLNMQRWQMIQQQQAQQMAGLGQVVGSLFGQGAGQGFSGLFGGGGGQGGFTPYNYMPTDPVQAGPQLSTQPFDTSAYLSQALPDLAAFAG